MKLPRIISVSPETAPAKSVIKDTAETLARGELVILPTETVYGIAADAGNAEAEKKLFCAKLRPDTKPISLLVSDIEQIEKRGGMLGDAERRVAKRYWPGPLTMVLPMNKGEGRFEGFRVPDHPVALAILNACGRALRVTSANIAGEPPALTMESAVNSLGQSVELALDSGPVKGGVPSSVVRFNDGAFEILREGAISNLEITEVCESMGLKNKTSGVESINNAERSENRNRRLLFVCTGNLCRSPMAEYLLRHRLKADSNWIIESAGTYAMNAMPASRQAVEVLSDRGIDLTPHRSRCLTQKLVQSMDLIVVMTEAHATQIKTLYPEEATRVFTLKSFDVGNKEKDVQDPIGSSKEVYRMICDEIDNALLDLIIYIKSMR